MFITIIYKKKEYLIDKDKLKFVLSRLIQKDIDEISDDKLRLLICEYKLYDEVFLREVNNIW